jgi:hypothetical protein
MILNKSEVKDRPQLVFREALCVETLLEAITCLERQRLPV